MICLELYTSKFPILEALDKKKMIFIKCQNNN